jgi:uncharacterized protein involved in exopolysaccharide biosynthesis
MNQDIRNIEPIDDEISPLELLEHLKSGWKWIAHGGAAGLASAILLAVLIPAQYEATAVVQPATIGMIGATPMAVEPVAQTIERLKLVAFYSDDIVKACDADSAKDLAEDLKVYLVRNNNLMSISYRAESATLAKACISKIVTQITQTQTTLVAQLIKELHDQQSSIKRQIDDAERFFAVTEQRTKSSPSLSGLDALLVLKREELLKLQKHYRELRIQMTEPLTQPAKLLEPIYVPEKPVAPKKLMVIASGLTGGMLIGLMAFFANRSWYRYKVAAKLA